MNNCPTPHNSAKFGEIAKTVIMPGDPKRAKLIAELFFTDAKLVNDVRGVQGYTGFYKGKEISVMASGMGCPSMGIYSYELFNFYDVENIIRVGTCGSFHDDVKLKEIVFAKEVLTNSNYLKQAQEKGEVKAVASAKLLALAEEVVKKEGIIAHVGKIFTSDTFYGENLEKFKNSEVLCIEMESLALYINAKNSNKNALTMLTVSDAPFKNIGLGSDERQNNFVSMLKIALEVAICL